MFSQGLKRVGVNDPVMLLDEVDKLGRDAVRGDPSAALLEVGAAVRRATVCRVLASWCCCSELLQAWCFSCLA